MQRASICLKSFIFQLYLEFDKISFPKENQSPLDHRSCPLLMPPPFRDEKYHRFSSF